MWTRQEDLKQISLFNQWNMLYFTIKLRKPPFFLSQKNKFQSINPIPNWRMSAVGFLQEGLVLLFGLGLFYFYLVRSFACSLMFTTVFLRSTFQPALASMLEWFSWFLWLESGLQHTSVSQLTFCLTRGSQFSQETYASSSKGV